MKNLLSIKKMVLVFIALLVFSCDPGEATVESDPYGDYALYGTIIDESTLNAIPNIEVTMQGSKVLGDENGYYEIRIPGSPLMQVYTINFIDQDHSMNGIYLSTDTVVDFTDIEFVNGNGSLYYGQKIMELNIKLASTTSL